MPRHYRPRIEASQSSTVEWTEANLIFGTDADYPGPLRWFPYQREILREWDEPSYQEFIGMTGAQLGKSTMFGGIIAKTAQEGLGMIVGMGTDGDIKSWWERTLLPLWKGSPSLQRIIPANNRGTISLYKGVLRYLGGRTEFVTSGSENQMKGRASIRVIGDEINTWSMRPDVSSPVDNLMARTYGTPEGSSKALLTSTPGVSGECLIQAEYLISSMGDWQPRCPHCKKLYPLDVKNNVDLEGATIHCLNCAKLQTDRAVMTGSANGGMVHKEPRNRRRGYHVSGLCSQRQWASTIMKRYSPTRAKTFWTQTLGLPYEAKPYGPWEPTDVQALYQDAPPGWRPNVVTVGADVRSVAIEAMIVEWAGGAAGLAGRIIQTVRVDGRVEDEDTWRRFSQALDRHRIDMLFIDRKYRSEIVQAMGKKVLRRLYGAKRIRFINGEDRHRPNAGVIMSSTGPNASKPFCAELNVPVAKDWGYQMMVEKCLTINGPGVDVDLPRHLSSEEVVMRSTSTGIERAAWVKKPGEPNHFWDCYIYALCARIECGLDDKPAIPTLDDILDINRI